MIDAHPHRGFISVFNRYLGWMLRRSFRGVWVSNGFAFPDGGFVAAPNHTSWWDGFVPLVLQTRLAPRTPFYLMMDETQLRRFFFFRWAGAFSVDAANLRKANASVSYAAQRARAGGGVWIFPEGRIEPPAAPAAFSSGYLHAAQRANAPIMPIAMRYAMLDAQRPDVFLDAAPLIGAGEPDAGERVRSSIVRMLETIDTSIADGTVFNNRFSLIDVAPGIDGAVSRFTGSIGKRL